MASATCSACGSLAYSTCGSRKSAAARAFPIGSAGAATAICLEEELMKWTGPAQWTRREARAGDRLPFERHLDDATIRLRDGALMRTLQIGGLDFETADSDQLQHAQQVRE